MKFEINVGTDYSTVKFNATLKLDVFEKLIHHFERLGGTMIGPKTSQWKFPAFITSEVLQEVIRNTCFECGGLMKDGQAIQNGEIRVPEEDIRGGYTPYVDTTNHSLIKVRKCSACGHSHT